MTPFARGLASLALLGAALAGIRTRTAEARRVAETGAVAAADALREATGAAGTARALADDRAPADREAAGYLAAWLAPREAAHRGPADLAERASRHGLVLLAEERRPAETPGAGDRIRLVLSGPWSDTVAFLDQLERALECLAVEEVRVTPGHLNPESAVTLSLPGPAENP